jgi:hypothetical protein
MRVYGESTAPAGCCKQLLVRTELHVRIDTPGGAHACTANAQAVMTVCTCEYGMVVLRHSQSVSFAMGSCMTYAEVISDADQVSAD